MSFPLDKERLIAATLYVLQKYEGEADFHTIFKTLYVADKDHLADYGRPITGDTYYAMDFGPVPSHLYDAFKDGNYSAFFKRIGQCTIISDIEPDMNELSKSDIGALDKAFNIINGLDFRRRTELTHDAAYNSAGRNSEISLIKIAQAGNANDEMIQYILTKLSNQESLA
jgi:hypothetical protein